MDATLLEKVATSIESNKSLLMLYINSGVVEAVLKGARGNTSLKKLTIGHTIESYYQQHLKTELRQVRPQLELHI